MSELELESEVSRLREVNTVTMSWRGVFARLQGELAEACAQDMHDLSALQARDDADRVSLHAAACDRTHVQLWLYAERQRHRNDGRVITDLWRCVSRHPSLVHSARVSLHSDRRHVYETCLRLLSSDIAKSTRQCGAVYHSDLHTQPGAYACTVKQGVHSIQVSLDHSLENPCFDDAPADLQQNSVSLSSTLHSKPSFSSFILRWWKSMWEVVIRNWGRASVVTFFSQSLCAPREVNELAQA